MEAIKVVELRIEKRKLEKEIEDLKFKKKLKEAEPDTVDTGSAIKVVELRIEQRELTKQNEELKHDIELKEFQRNNLITEITDLKYEKNRLDDEIVEIRKTHKKITKVVLKENAILRESE